MRNIRWQTKRRALFTGIGVIFSLVLLLPAAGRFWLTSDHGRRVIQEKVNGAIPGTLTWDDLSLSLFAGHVEVRNLLLEGPSGDRIAALDRVFVNLAWTALVRGELAVEAVTLEKPRVWLGADRNGELNIMKAFPAAEAKEPEPESPSGEFPFNVVIGTLTLTDGFFQYEAIESSELLAVHNIGLTVTDGNLSEKSARFSLLLGRGEIDMADIKTAFHQFRFDGTLRQGHLESVLIEIDSDLASLDVTGSVRELFSPPFFDLDITLNTSLSKIRQTFQVSQELTGPVRLHLKIRGRADNPEADLSLAYEGGEIAGTRVDRAALACSLKERVLVFKQLDMETPMGRVAATGEVDLRNAFGEGFTTPERDLDAVSYKLDLRQSAASLEKLPGGAGGMRGDIETRLILEGEGISPEAMTAKALLELSGRKLAMEKVLAPFDLDLNTRAVFENNRITVPQLYVGTGETRLEGSGSFDLSSDIMEAVLALDAPDLSRLMLSPVAEGLGGKLTLNAGISGTVGKPVVDARFLGEGLGVSGITLGNICLNAGLDSTGMWNITDMELKNRDSLLQAEGTIRIFEDGVSPDFPSDITVRFQNIRAKNFLEPERVSGRMDGVFTCRGALLSPEATLALHGRSLAAGEHRVGDMDGRLRLSHGLLILDQLGLRNGKSNLNLTGTARLLDAETGKPVKKPAFNVKVGSDGLYLEDFVRDMQGKLVLNGHFKGDTAHPAGNLALEGSKIDFGVQKIHGVHMASRLDKDRVTVDSLTVALAPGEEILADGWVSPVEKQYALRLTSEGFSLKNIDPIGEKNAVEGEVALHVSGRGSFDNPRLNGEVTINRFRLKEEPFDDSTFRLALQDHIARISGNLIADLNGWFNLETRAFSTKARFDNVGLAPFFKMGGRDDLTGSLTGLAEAEGNAASPEKIRAIVDISGLSVVQNGAELLSTGAFSASCDSGEVLVPDTRFTLMERGYLDISGEGRLDGSMDFKADGSVPLEVVKVFAEDLSDITGKVKLAASFRGTLDRPDFRADLSLDQIGLTVPVLEQKLHSVNGRIQVTPETISVEQLNGSLDKGRFNMSGTLALEDFKPASVDARVNAHALPVTVPDTLGIILNGELAFAGTPDKSGITGEIVILEGRYLKDVKLGLMDSMVRKTREEAPVPKEETTPFLRNTDLNIAIRHRAPFVVDNNLALMALKPTLKIYGSLNNPLVSGRAQVESGTITYLGKDFEVKKGVVDFLNPYKIEPTIDLDSQVEVRTWTIYLKVSGVVDNLQFEMRSEPAEADEDILSLLAFGKTTEELIKGEGGSSKSTKQMLADMIAKTLQESLKDATGLDTIEMKYTERTDEADSDDVNITVGKELSKRMTVKYGVGTKNGVTVQSAITEYKFLENVLMNTFQDTEGDFGGELVFRLEFR